MVSPESSEQGTESSRGELADLVARVRKAQKETKRQGSQWNCYCETYGDGRRDPRRHTAEFLRRFLEELQAGGDLPELPPEVEAAEQRAAAAARGHLREEAKLDVPSADVEAAKARLAAESGQEVWRLLPPPWRPLYERTQRFDYDLLQFDFVEVVREMLDCPEGVPLSRLHEVQRPPEFEPCPPLRKGMLLAGMKLAPEKRVHKSRNHNKRDWYNSLAYTRFMELYRSFLRQIVLPDFCKATTATGEDGGCEEREAALEAIVQSSPVLRVVMPSAHYATLPHKDADYGHLPEELNFWLPLTPVGGSNSLFVEGFPGRGDFEAFAGEAGHAFRFWGNQCAHYAQANATDSTRVSLDFRVVPRVFWDAADAAGVMPSFAERRTFFHEGELALGSYYRLERAELRQSEGTAGD